MTKWVVLLGGIMLNVFMLLTVPSGFIVFQSLAITSVSAAAIIFYLYKSYAKNIVIKSDILIALNTLIQFLIPVFYLVFYYTENPDIDIHGYRSGMAITSFAILIAQAVFFAGYESFKKDCRFPKVAIAENSYLKLFFILTPLYALTWASRYILLVNGTYYMIARSDYQYMSPFSSIMGQISSFGLLIVAAFFVIAFSEERPKEKTGKFFLAGIIVLFEIIWYLPSGMRESLILNGIIIIFAYVFVKRKIPVKALAVFTVILFIILPILGEYKKITVRDFESSRIEPGQIVSSLDMAKTQFEDTERNFIANVTARLYDGACLGYLLVNYMHDYSPEKGATYKHIPFIFIPRFLYPDKPVVSIFLNEWYPSLIRGGCMPVTFWGESYLNFSWPGLIFISYVMGLAMKLFDYLFMLKSNRPYWIYVYVFSFAIIARLPIQPMVVWISFILKIIAIAFILDKVSTIFIRPTKKKTI